MDTILIIGAPGSGKTASIRTLDPKETFIIGAIQKVLPFKSTGYKPVKGDKGNMFFSSDFASVMKCIEYVNKKRPDIKNLILDDWQYLLVNEFMKRAFEKGYDKFTQIGFNGWSLINAMRNLRPDLFGVVIAHNDLDDGGYYKLKTLGKLLDDKVAIEGMFSCVLHAMKKDSSHIFLTQSNGSYIAKSPMEMLDEEMPNDLALIRAKMAEYYNQEIPVLNNEEIK